LGVSERTIQRKQVLSERLNLSASDRLARVGRIYDLAKSVLGSPEKAAEWMKRSSSALSNEISLRLLDIDVGTQEVENELSQLEYGLIY
jgi:putative toxin-antitoxin system antitoxin component (TIGR02293 family)